MAIAFAVLAILVFVGALMAPRNIHDSSGNCELHARAAVISKDTPLGQATGWTTDVLAIRNDDDDEWKNLDVTIYGFVTTGTAGRRTTGPYRATRPASSKGNLLAFQLNDFANASGERWVSLTMAVDLVSLKASLRGESCSGEFNPNISTRSVLER
jgi:hypothetical protein